MPAPLGGKTPQVDMAQLPPALADELLAVSRKVTAADVKADDVGYVPP